MAKHCLIEQSDRWARTEVAEAEAAVVAASGSSCAGSFESFDPSAAVAALLQSIAETRRNTRIHRPTERCARAPRAARAQTRRGGVGAWRD